LIPETALPISTTSPSDLVVGPAHSDVEHAEPDLIVPLQRGGLAINDANLFLRREHRDCAHGDLNGQWLFAATRYSGVPG
jgi:hypothetical protein